MYPCGGAGVRAECGLHQGRPREGFRERGEGGLVEGAVLDARGVAGAVRQGPGEGHAQEGGHQQHAEGGPLGHGNGDSGQSRVARSSGGRLTHWEGPLVRGATHSLGGSSVRGPDSLTGRVLLSGGGGFSAGLCLPCRPPSPLRAPSIAGAMGLSREGGGEGEVAGGGG